MKLGVAIVGLGDRWEGQYLPAIRSLADRFEVRAVCEQVSLRATRAASELHAEAVDGFRVMAGREDVDAVLCLGDQWYGTAPILAACDAGKAVYSAASLPACRSQLSQLFSRVESSGVAFMAELSRRHAPATVRLKELIAHPELNGRRGVVVRFDPNQQRYVVSVRRGEEPEEMAIKRKNLAIRA